MRQPCLTTFQEFSSIVLDGHPDSVNAVKFDADLSMLLSGGKSFVKSSVCLPNYILLPDNSGRIIICDLGSHKPLQTIDASFASSATSLYWINVLKYGTTDENPSPAFAVGFGTGIVAIYRQSLENVRNLKSFLEHDIYCFLQHLFEFVKNIEAHDGPVEDLAFDRFFLRLASAGAGYPQVWGLGTSILIVRSLDLMFRQVLRMFFIEFPHRSPDSVHTYARAYILLTEVKALWSPIPSLIPCKSMCHISIFSSLTSLLRMKYIIEPWSFKSSRLLQTRM